MIETNEDWFLEWPEQQRRISALAAYHSQYQKEYVLLPDYRDIMRYLALCGAPTHATKAGISKECLATTLLCAQDYRARYSVAAALSELGLLEESVAEIVDREDIL